MNTEKIRSDDVWSARGVWWWAGLLTAIFCFSIYDIRTIGHWLLPLLVMFMICAWWYRESKGRGRRGPASRVIGYLLFGLGTIFLIYAGMFTIMFVDRKVEGYVSFTLIFTLVCLVVDAGILAASFFCVFVGRKTKAELPSPLTP